VNPLGGVYVCWMVSLSTQVIRISFWFAVVSAFEVQGDDVALMLLSAATASN